MVTKLKSVKKKLQTAMFGAPDKTIAFGWEVLQIGMKLKEENKNSIKLMQCKYIGQYWKLI